MGENIIVFDFIRDGIAAEIFEAMLAGTLKDAASQDMTIQISDNARLELRKLCLADLSNGGRGIRNKVEAHLINPLARALFDSGVKRGGRAVISAIRSGKVTQLELREVQA
jgi:ATP-dependent Clp protease ATP-binding subunit ClpA